jgi:hypothetical protein
MKAMLDWRLVDLRSDRLVFCKRAGKVTPSRSRNDEHEPSLPHGIQTLSLRGAAGVNLDRGRSKARRPSHDPCKAITTPLGPLEG